MHAIFDHSVGAHLKSGARWNVTQHFYKRSVCVHWYVSDEDQSLCIEHRCFGVVASYEPSAKTHSTVCQKSHFCRKIRFLTKSLWSKNLIFCVKMSQLFEFLPKNDFNQKLAQQRLCEASGGLSNLAVKSKLKLFISFDFCSKYGHLTHSDNCSYSRLSFNNFLIGKKRRCEQFWGPPIVEGKIL